MPTFRNDSTKTYSVDSTAGSVNVTPGSSVQTYVALDRRYGTDFVQTAATPYYNPVLKRHAVTLTGSGTTELVIENINCSLIRIMRVTQNVDVHLSAAANPNPFPVDADSIVDFDNVGKISALYFDHTVNTTLVVLEIK